MNPNLISPIGNDSLPLIHLRRAREGIAELKKSSYKKKTDPKGLEYFQNCVGEKTKNHRQDKEDRSKGLIPFVNDEHGWNPGILKYAELPSFKILFPPWLSNCLGLNYRMNYIFIVYM